MLLSITGCSNKNKYTSIEYGTSAEELESKLEATPNTIQEKETMTDEIYDEVDAYGYTGSMTYHFSSDKSVMMYSEWKTKASDLENCKEIYKNIRKELKDENGDCAESKTDNSAIATWDDGKCSITLSYEFSKDDPYVYVSRIENTGK